MHLPKFIPTPASLHKEQQQQQQQSNGVIYTQSSDFVLPSEINKHEISCPVSARPMGAVDITANDWVYSNGSPSRNELRTIKKHAKQTAHALGTGSKKVLAEAQGQTEL